MILKFIKLNFILCSVILIFSFNPLFSDNESVTFQFLDENNKPLAGAGFYFYENENKEFVKAWHRGTPLNENGSIIVDNLPQEFDIGVVSSDEYYYRFLCHKEIEIKNNILIIHVPKTGKISFQFSKYPETHKETLVVPYFKLDESGQYIHQGGIGIFVIKRNPLTISGLEPGLYKIQIKHNYENQHVIWEKSNIEVNAGKETEISPITINENQLYQN